MADQGPPEWGRAARRYRREAARELAREIMHSHNQRQTGTPQLDVALWFLAAFMALGLLLVAPKIGRGVTAVVLIAMAACLLHPLWQLRLVQTAPSLAKKRWRFAGTMLIALGALALFGMYVWPPIRRHRLDQAEWAKFEKPLKAQTEPHEEIQMACAQADEAACIYAEQFINIFRDAGWNVQNNRLDRVTLARPWSGVVLFKKGTGKLDSNDWRSGLWTRMSPSLVSVYQAFENIEVEPDAGTNPDLSEDVMTVYFGSEKANEGEPTSLTTGMQKFKEFKKTHP